MTWAWWGHPWIRLLGLSVEWQIWINVVFAILAVLELATIAMRRRRNGKDE